MKKNYIGFTLIELIVAIAIITIIGVSATRINFNSMNDIQKVEIFTNKIVVLFEQIRNNALLGKGIGTNLETPEKWKIDFSGSGSGQVISSYYSGGWIEYEKIIFGNGFEISNIDCFNALDNVSMPLSGIDTGIVEINGSNLTATGYCFDEFVYGEDYFKILKTTIKYKKNLEKTIEINTVNGLVKKL